MIHISVRPPDNSDIKKSDMAARTAPATKRAVQPSVPKWKSSFKPVEEDENSQDNSTNCPERVVLYDPYDPASSDSEPERPHSQDRRHSLPNQDTNLGRQHLSPGRGGREKSRWDVPYSEPVSRPLDRRNLSPESRPTVNRGLSPGHRLCERQAYSPDTEPLVPSGFGSVSRPLDHRVGQSFSASYGAQMSNGEERITIPEYRREMTTTDRLSPSRLQRDYQDGLGYVKAGLDKITPSTEVTGNRRRNLIMDRCPITCELCDIELANSQELQHHLESKTHWDTLEHIQQKNNYDDLTVAFLQEFMLYKSYQCSRAIEDSVLQALQENDHMTKIQIFHCAACNIFLSTSASSVHTHITSQEHLINTKEFEVQQRRACLDKAETMMKGLKPQFEHFLKGGRPFE
nr:uncharacterized protein LOC124070092 isoform X2 [Scatophagus argus]